MSEPLFNKVALIGIGLIGSSLARVIRRENLANTIIVNTRREETLNRARELNLGDDYYSSAAEAVRDADLVIVCVPVGACGQVAAEIAPALKPGAIVTDVGSTKRSVIQQMAPVLPDTIEFVPGHPIAGTEHSGPDAGFAELVAPTIRAIVEVLDTDGDGEVSPTEMVKWFDAIGLEGAVAENAFRLLDTDGTGKLSVNELVDAVRDYHLGKNDIPLLGG